jgi:serine/threonine-protein kinase
MATVYLAQDLRHKRRVALKVLDPELGLAVGAERFRREIEMATELQHPHVLPVFDSGEAGTGGLWYTMPYVEGESLRERIRLRDLWQNRAVALKVLDPELAHSLGHERFLREIRFSAQLQHPHILPILDSGVAAAQLWYTMPYAEGDSLRERLRREPQLRIEGALGIACEVASALGYAHQQGIVHRDIKPENILLSQYHALVADFGIARAIGQAAGERLTATGILLGTPAYMSPEQAVGSRELDGQSDQYSLACVLFEMLAGEPPFADPSPQVIIARRVTHSPPRLSLLRPEVSSAVEAAVTKALAREPADRYRSADEFAGALSEAGADRHASRRSTLGEPR